MRVTPKSEDEVRMCLPAGVYQATVQKAEEKTSKSGNEMIEIELAIYSGDNKVLLRDWLLDNTAGKLRHFCIAAGLMRQYEGGHLTASDCIDCSVWVRTKVKSDPTGQYYDQAAVSDYVIKTADDGPSRTSAAAPTKEEIEEAEKDGIPF